MASPFSALAAEARKLEADAVVLFHKDISVLSQAVHAALATAEEDARQAVAAASPEIKAASDAALKVVEQAILAALAAHGL
jgi:hypothetical protein